MLDNRSRIYALESWTVEKKRRGWFIKRTHSADAWRGPYRTEMSACLTIARLPMTDLLKIAAIHCLALPSAICCSSRLQYRGIHRQRVGPENT
jgi:hypothetical protein